MHCLLLTVLSLLHASDQSLSSVREASASVQPGRVGSVREGRRVPAPPPPSSCNLSLEPHLILASCLPGTAPRFLWGLAEDPGDRILFNGKDTIKSTAPKLNTGLWWAPGLRESMAEGKPLGWLRGPEPCTWFCYKDECGQGPRVSLFPDRRHPYLSLGLKDPLENPRFAKA